MPRLTPLLLAGALCWPAASFAQVSQSVTPPWASRPTTAPSGTLTPAPSAGAERLLPPPLPPQDGPPPLVSGPTVQSPIMPPAPGRVSVGARNGVVVPDISGMPSADQPQAAPGTPVPPPVAGGNLCCDGPLMPPGVCVPVPPMPCCPPMECDEGGPAGILLRGDLLYLRPRRNDPIVFSQFSNGALQTAVEASYETDWSAAYRVGGGFISREGFLFAVDYTQFKDTVALQSLVFPDDPRFDLQYIGPGQLIALSPQPGDTLTASWNLQYRTVDIMFGTVFSPADCLDFIVAGGGRLAWIDQDYRTTFNGAAAGLNSQGEILSNSLRAGGARFGSEARLYIYRWLSLNGRGYASALLTHREEISILLEADPTGLVVPPISVVRYEREEIMPVLELAIGLEVNPTPHLSIGVGYELHYWWNLGSSNVEAVTTADFTKPNDVSLDGLYLRAAWLW